MAVSASSQATTSEGQEKERQREKGGQREIKDTGRGGDGCKKGGERQMGKTSVKESEGEGPQCQ